MNKDKELIKSICMGGLLAALYIVTTVINPIGFGAIQLRISAIISVIPFFKPKFKIPCIIAVAIANIFSPLGFIDVSVGILLWAVAYYIFDFAMKNIYIKCAATEVLSGVLIGLELWVILRIPFLVNFESITVSQSIVFAIAIVFLKRLFKTKTI